MHEGVHTEKAKLPKEPREPSCCSVNDLIIPKPKKQNVILETRFFLHFVELNK